MADAWIEQRRQQIRERMRREPGYAPIGVAELRDLGVDIAGRPLQTYEQAAGARVPGGLPQEGFLPPRPSPFEGDYPPGWSQQGTGLQDALARRARRFTEDPGFGKETEAERAARRAAQDAAYQQSLAPPGPPPPLGERPSTIPGPPEPFAGTFPPRPEGLAGGLPGQPPPPFNMARPEGPPGGLPGQQNAQSVADIFGGGGAGPPDPFAGVGRPEGPPAGMPQMTPNMPRPRPMDSMIAGRPDAPLGGMPAPPQFAGNPPQPRPEPPGPYADVGGPRVPQPRPNTDAQFAMLPNGPREFSLGIQTPGGQQSRLPQNRPPLPTDGPPSPLAPDPAQRIAGAFPPSPSPAQPAPAALAPAGVPSGQNLVTPDMDAAGPPPPFGTMIAPAIDPTQAATRGQPQQVPPDRGTVLAREEAKRTLQLHPDTGRIPTAPGLQQFNEPARQAPGPQRPLIRPDLTEAAANYRPAPLPRARPDYNPEAMGSDVPPDYDPLSSIRAPAPAPPRPGPIMRADSGLPDTAMASIRSSYDPTAMGGPTTPETPEEVVARKALLARRGTPPDVVEGYAEEEDLIAKPAVGAINEGQPLPPPPPPEIQQPSPPAIPQQQTIEGPRTGLEGFGEYQGPTAQSRFGGNIFQRISIPHERHIGGPGLMGPLNPAKEQKREGGGRYFKNAQKGGRGDYKAPIGTRTAGRVGGWGGGILGFLGGGPLGAIAGNRLGTYAGKTLGKWGVFDENRGWIDSRTGRPLKGGDKDGDKKDSKSVSAPAGGVGNVFGGGSMGPSGSPSSGLGGDRAIGRDYGGYGYGSDDPYARFR